MVTLGIERVTITMNPDAAYKIRCFCEAEDNCECGHTQWTEHKSSFDPLTAQECNVKGCKCKKFKLKK